MTPKVWNIHDPNCPKDAFYIGRANRRYHLAKSKYANPFRIGVKRNRKLVCALYKTFADAFFTDAEMAADLGGKDLACWCAPLQCHGDYLLAQANKKEKRNDG